MRELAKPNEQLLKPTATVHVGNRLSLIERRVFNALLWQFQRSPPADAKTASIMPVEQLMLLIGLARSHNLDVVKEALERLTTTAIVWNSLRKDRTTHWGVCTFLAGAEISNGQLRYLLNPLLVEKVGHPTLFAKIQLLVQTQFSSKYSLALYEFLIDELCRSGSPETHSVQVSLDTVRHVLQYDGPYKHLNADVLKPCTREINKYSDIAVQYQGIKKGRAVAALLFTVERKKVPVQLVLDGLVDAEAGSADETQTPSEEPLVTALIQKGIAKRKARTLVEHHDPERIRGNIAHAEREHRAGKVQNFSAYLVRAIEDDYRPQPEPAPKPSEPSPQVAVRQAQAKLKEDWKAFRNRRVRERFAALTEAEQEAHRAAFVERIQQDQPIVLKQYQKDGFESRMVEAHFYHELIDQLLEEPAEVDLKAYRVAFGGETPNESAVGQRT